MGKEHLGDEATVKLVQLLLGQHQPVSLSKASCAREGHFAHENSVIPLLFLGLGVSKGKRRPGQAGAHLSCVPLTGPLSTETRTAPGRLWLWGSWPVVTTSF